MRSWALYEDKQQHHHNPNSQKNSFFGQHKQGGSNLKINCCLCGNQHVKRRGIPSAYLGLCSYFKDLSVSKQKEALKVNKFCSICLNPRNECRDANDQNAPCWFQSKFDLKCKQCGQKTHHSLMCTKQGDNNFFQNPALEEDAIEAVLEVLDMGAEVEAELPMIEVTKVLQHSIMILKILAITKMEVASQATHVSSKVSRVKDLRYKFKDLNVKVKVCRTLKICYI